MKYTDSNFDQAEKKAFITMLQPAFRTSQELNKLFSINDPGGHHRQNHLTGVSKFVSGN